MITAAHRKLSEEGGGVANYKHYDSNRLVDYETERRYGGRNSTGLDDSDPNNRDLDDGDDEDRTLQYYINTLTNMGYKANLIDTVLGEISDISSVSLEQMMNRISELQVDCGLSFMLNVSLCCYLCA